MSSMAAALTRDYLRRSWLPTALAVANLVGLPWCGYGLVLWNGIRPPDDAFRDVPLPFSFLFIVMIGIVTVVLMGQGDQRFGLSPKLFVLPIPTWLAVVCRMLQAGMTTVAVYVVTVVSYNLIFGTQWPVVAPVLALVVAAWWTQTFAWTLWHFRLWRLVALVAVVAGFGHWLASRLYPDGWNEPARSWNEVSLVDALMLVAFTAAALIASVLSAHRYRHGDSESFDVWLTRFEPWWDRLLGRGETRFRSAESALFWKEWTRRGVAMPAAMGCLMLVVPLVGAVAVALGWAQPIGVLEVQLALAVPLYPQLAFIVGLFMGHRNTNTARMEYDTYSATRPLTDAALANVFLRSCALSVLSAFAVSAACCLATLGWVCWQQEPAVLEPLERKLRLMNTAWGGWSVMLIALATLLAAWASLGLGSFLILFGRARVITWGIGLPIGVLISAMIVINFIVPNEYAAFYSAVFTGFLGLVLAAATAWAFLQALRKRLISARTLIVAFFGWLALCGVVAAVLSFGSAPVNPTPALHRWLALPFLPGLLALVFVPLAAAPLALAANRHR